jgi:NADH:ubiquinone oxidoreductase subunit K
MEIIILTVVVVGLAVVAVWYYNRDSKSLDVNNDGRVDAQDAMQALKTTAQGISQDVRDTRDAALIAAAETAMKAAGVIETAKKTTKAKVAKVTAAKKSATRKPRAKK